MISVSRQMLVDSLHKKVSKQVRSKRIHYCT